MNSRSTTPLGRMLACAAACAACLGAQATWVHAGPECPPARGGHVLAPDAAGRVTMFGSDSRVGADTWQWDGNGWVERHPAQIPVGGGGAAAYDSARGRVVWFRARESNGAYLTETWEWDGVDWIRLSPANSPPPRGNHALAYDAGRGCVVLFGGRFHSSGSVRQFDDTWEWDGNDWMRRISATRPSARSGHALAYDAGRGRVVLFGGIDRSVWPSQFHADTWEWDGQSWTQRHPAASPPARADTAMSLDAASGRLVMFGGWPGGNGQLADTWEWDGSTWTRRSPAHSPGERYSHAMTHDVARRRIVLMGGYYLRPQFPFGVVEDVRSDTWEWDGTDWREWRPPWPAAEWHALAHDRSRDRVVRFGGHSGVTEEWNGVGWTECQPAVSPPAIDGPAMAYCAVRNRVLLFGGSRTDDTWEWDGQSWSRLRPAVRPPARELHAMASDTNRRRILLFGGFDTTTATLFADTWEWDGASWQHRAVATAPPARFAAAMAYDAARGRVVLFGGGDVLANATLADTWEWDGAGWARCSPVTSPPARLGHAMAFDPARGRVVLFGGTGIGGFTMGGGMSDTWEWDGTTWTPVAPPVSPPGQQLHAMAYHAGQRCVVMLGPAGTWLFGDRLTPASAQPFGASCPTAGGPQLVGFGVPAFGNGSFALDLRAAPAHAPAAIGLSLGGQSMPLGPCTLHVQQILAALPVMANAHGFGSVGAPVPADPRLVGAVLFAQGFVADRNGPVLGVAMTGGVRLTLGN